jgi:hypothetical protein
VLKAAVVNYRPVACRDFVLHIVEKGVTFDEAVMNLPHNATDFVDAFIGLSSRLGDR